MSTSAGIPEGEPQQTLTAKNGRPLTVWDMRIEKSGQTVRQSVVWLSITWLLSGVGGFIYWWVRSVQKHGEITQRDIDEWPLFVATYSVVGLILIYLFFHNVLPVARRDLAKLQQDAKSQDMHSSTTAPES